MILQRALAGCLFVSLASSVLARDLSEQDYFSDLPEVLTVTRLAQPLSDTPGAVTIIDRDKIRRSGARDVTDVLRLVPGYLIGGVNGSHLSPAYHAPLDDYGTRNLVLIDGRSAYNSYYVGQTNRGLQGVLLEDIERIEVLRGSNSAAYGANAMFGVINIITRHSADTHGADVSYAKGGGGIDDRMARVGWGNESASFRLSAGRRADTGWKGAHDDRAIDQLNFRGDFRPTPEQELLVTAGSMDMQLEDGAMKNDGSRQAEGNPFRLTSWRENFVNVQWRRQYSAGNELKLSASYDEVSHRDRAPFAPDPSVTLDFGGQSSKTILELQQQIALSPELRAVWGAGYERNEAKSRPLFYRDSVVVHEERLFGNLEWRPHEQWVVNAGGYWNRHSWVGSNFSPRLMANFHATPDHTFRAGASKSVRTPNLFELAADVRYYPKNANNTPIVWPLPLDPGVGDLIPLFANMNIPIRWLVSSGTLKPEELQTEEVGYFGNIRELRMTVDVRAYIETMSNLVGAGKRAIPGYISGTLTLPGPVVIPVVAPTLVADFANKPGFKIRGIEYQLRWKPMEDTEIWLNQNFQKLTWDNEVPFDDRDNRIPPTHATTVAWFQKLSGGLDLSVMLHSMGAMTWGGSSDSLPPRQRVDARLAWPFRIGSTHAEMALNVQSGNGNSAEYLLRRGYESERRTFATLRVEF